MALIYPVPRANIRAKPRARNVASRLENPALIIVRLDLIVCMQSKHLRHSNLCSSRNFLLRTPPHAIKNKTHVGANCRWNSNTQLWIYHWNYRNQIYCCATRTYTLIKQFVCHYRTQFLLRRKNQLNSRKASISGRTYL